MTIPERLPTIVVIVVAAIVMLGGMWVVFAHLKRQQESFGPNSLRALGIVIFIPTLLLIAAIRKEFNSQALAALLGSVAGYALLGVGPKEDGSSKSSTGSTDKALSASAGDASERE